MHGNRKDETFTESKLLDLLQLAKERVHTAPTRAKIAMNQFVSTVGISYKALHEKALQVAKKIGPIEIKKDNKKSTQLSAYEAIQKNIEKGRIDFKRKHVRC